MLSRSFERLASGARINTAADDAAGLAIADKLRADVRTTTTAIRNVNDGISALSILTNSLSSQLSITQRLQELATQSANGTLSTNQRYTLNREYQTLIREFGRIGDTTKFNNVNLLLGGHGSSNSSNLSLQVGITGSSSSTIGFTLTDSGTLSGILSSDPMADVPAFADGFNFSIDTLDDTFTPSGNNLVRRTITDSFGREREVLVSVYGSLSSNSIEICTFIRGDQSDGTSTNSADRWVYIDHGACGIDPTTGTAIGSGLVTTTLTGFAGGATGIITLDMRGLRVLPGTVGANTNTIEMTGIESVATSRKALNLISQRQADIQNLLGTYGAVQSRLASASNVLMVSRENSAAAESRIRDVDVAEESSQLIKSQILQKVASSVLAQANQQPALAISLLRTV